MRKVALITGGTKGIGLAIGHSLLSEGYHVALTGRYTDRCYQLQKKLSKKYADKVKVIAANVSDYHRMINISQEIIDVWGALDVLIANAGVGHFANIEDMTNAQWNEVIDVNLTGVFNSVKSTIPALKKSKGYIITIASLAGANFFEKGAAYNASKFGLVGFTQAVMLDVRKYGIKVSTIMPGSVATHFNGNVPGEKDIWKIPPEDIAQMVIDLLKMPERTLPSKVEMRPSFKLHQKN